MKTSAATMPTKIAAIHSMVSMKRSANRGTLRASRGWGLTGLVSDIVAYHPQKRDEGVRNNTLAQLFKEEIKKSYEEYVEQVGREFADSTTHFQDALNEVLAGGKKLFPPA